MSNRGIKMNETIRRLIIGLTLYIGAVATGGTLGWIIAGFMFDSVVHDCTRLHLTYKPLTNDSLYEWNGDVSICDGSELRVPVNGDMLIVKVVE